MHISYMEYIKVSQCFEGCNICLSMVDQNKANDDQGMVLWRGGVGGGGRKLSRGDEGGS